MGANKSKRRWDSGHMWIELTDDVKHYFAETEVKGIIHLDLTKPFNAYSLIV